MLHVTMPTYRTPPELLDRAVRSVLSQNTDLRLIVIGDGEEPDVIADDDRLTVFVLPENRGRYFADSVAVLALSESDWWTPHDSDDWSEPGRYKRLLRVAKPYGAALSSYWKYDTDGRKIRSNPKVQGSGFRHVGHWCSGVYRMDRVLECGGILPQFRVSTDTLFVSLVSLVGSVGIDTTPSFHWERRSGSLTTANGTSMQSSLRQATRFSLRKIYAEAERHWKDGQPIANVVRSSVPDKVQAEVEEEAVRLAELLD